jgi:hypothetical protein
LTPQFFEERGNKKRFALQNSPTPAKMEEHNHNHMIRKGKHEGGTIGQVLKALASPVKELRRTMSTPSKAGAGETPPSGLKVRKGMWVGGKTPPVGTLLGIAPSPCTPVEDDTNLMTPTPGARRTPQHMQHMLGMTPEMRAALPSHPLTQWTPRDVAICLKILGREVAREGSNSAGDVSAFDTYAEAFVAAGIDGAAFASISIPQLSHELGVGNYTHRLKIVSWIKGYLEVSAG